MKTMKPMKCAACFDEAPYASVRNGRWRPVCYDHIRYPYVTIDISFGRLLVEFSYVLTSTSNRSHLDADIGPLIEELLG